ncbi:MAG TPA: FMN-binding protein [Candidatus Eisenbacteria bacterium]|nr:FMN-binding protein [Candidatus Eisenbacteria bacterium]
MRLAVAAMVLLAAFGARAQEGAFLSEAEAPRAVFPRADGFERREVPATPERRTKVTQALGGALPSMWEERWVVFRVSSDGTNVGWAIIVEEIGKHRPITFVVGLRPDRSVEDVAVMSYREAYGGEIRSPRFLRQYAGKTPQDDLRAYQGVKNIAGATLSVEAASRAVHKAQAIATLLDEAGS